VPKSAWGSQGLPSAISWLQPSFMNLASCQVKTEKDGSSDVQLALCYPGACVKELVDTHATRLGSPPTDGHPILYW